MKLITVYDLVHFYLKDRKDQYNNNFYKLKEKKV